MNQTKSKSNTKTKRIRADIVLRRIIKSIRECADDSDFLVDLCKQYYPIRENMVVEDAEYSLEGDDIVILKLKPFE